MDFVIRDSPDLEPGQYRKQYICAKCIALVKHYHSDRKDKRQ